MVVSSAVVVVPSDAAAAAPEFAASRAVPITAVSCVARGRAVRAGRERVATDPRNGLSSTSYAEVSASSKLEREPVGRVRGRSVGAAAAAACLFRVGIYLPVMAASVPLPTYMAIVSIIVTASLSYRSVPFGIGGGGCLTDRSAAFAVAVATMGRTAPTAGGTPGGWVPGQRFAWA